MINIIPAIDIIDGKLVRLFQGDYTQKTEYEQSPIDMALYYQSLGLTHIHVVDLNGARDGKLSNFDIINEVPEKHLISIKDVYYYIYDTINQN